tara:strand:+ start:1182 stop:1451 length:270 start_codon:yes stop_codon:yes gene_type:complete
VDTHDNSSEIYGKCVSTMKVPYITIARSGGGRGVGGGAGGGNGKRRVKLSGTAKVKAVVVLMGLHREMCGGNSFLPPTIDRSTFLCLSF